jgi:PAS domain S-box-containing protein
MGPSTQPSGGKRFGARLRRKVVATVALVYAVLTLNFLYLIVVDLHRMVEKEATDTVTQKARFLSAALSERIDERDPVLLDDFLAMVLRDGEIEFARIMDGAGAVLAEAGVGGKYPAPSAGNPEAGRTGDVIIQEIGRQEGLLHGRGHLFFLASPIVLEGSPMGELHLGMNTVAINRRLALLTYRGVAVAAATILAGVALSYFLYLQMRRAMRELIGTTASIAEGNLDRRVSVATGDEFEELGQSLNRMAQAVAEREGELKRLRNTMVSMFDGITAGIAYIDREYRILHANRAYLSLFGKVTEAGPEGRRCYDLLGGGEEACERCPGRAALRSGKSEGAEREIVTGDGEKRVMWIHAYPVPDASGEPAGFVEYVSDITKQRIMEEELRNYTEHLEEIVEERTRRLKEAQEKMLHREKIAALGQLAAGVAHEVGNPLSSLSSLVRSLGGGGRKDGDREEKFRLMQEQIERIARIVREMGDFSRPASFRKGLVHVNEVVKTSLGIARYDHRMKEVHVITGLDGEIPALRMDGDKLLQVFLNILFNAADAMEGRGTLTVTSRLDGASISVTFADSGPGIPEESLSRVFEPFYTTKDVGEGTGLGLSVGTIRAENRRGGGSAFTVDIPLAHPAGEAG